MFEIGDFVDVMSPAQVERQGIVLACGHRSKQRLVISLRSLTKAVQYPNRKLYMMWEHCTDLVFVRQATTDDLPLSVEELLCFPNEEIRRLTVSILSREEVK